VAFGGWKGLGCRFKGETHRTEDCVPAFIRVNRPTAAKLYDRGQRPSKGEDLEGVGSWGINVGGILEGGERWKSFASVEVSGEIVKLRGSHSEAGVGGFWGKCRGLPKEEGGGGKKMILRGRAEGSSITLDGGSRWTP